jgi:predicted ribosome quality control (RQC) complex YloA/Tae2 family protein
MIKSMVLEDSPGQLERDRQRLLTWVRRHLIRSENNLKKFCADYERCSRWDRTKHEATLLQANLYRVKRGDRSVVMQDWEAGQQEISLPLDPLEEPHEQVVRLFRLSRKMQRALDPLTKMIARSKEHISYWQSCLIEIEKVEDLEALKALREKVHFHHPVKPKEAVKGMAKPYHRYLSLHGVEIWVGKSARSNDQLTFHYASGNDWWLHANGYAGSHLVIKGEKGADLDPEVLQDALQLAIYHSKGRMVGEGEVCLTQRKYVTRYGTVAGKVQVSKHKNLQVRLDPERLKRLRRVT